MENFKDVFNFVKETVAEINKTDLDKQKFMNENSQFNKAFNDFIEKKFPEDYKKLLSEGGLEKSILGDSSFITKFGLHALKKTVKSSGGDTDTKDFMVQGEEAIAGLKNMNNSLEENPFLRLIESYKTLYEGPLDSIKFQKFFDENGISIENNQSNVNKDKKSDEAESKSLESNDSHTSPIDTKNIVLAPEIEQVMSNVEIRESFATIKEVKYEDKIILAATGESPYINKDALPDLIGFALAFHKKTGDALTINSSYRDLDHQEELHEKYKKGKGNLAAEPGKSGHNLGLSIDIHAGDRYSKQLGGVQGLREIAKQYNFSPIESEDRHFDHKLFVDMKSTKEDRLALAKKMNDEYKNVA